MLEAGLLLVVIPWSTFWDRNYFAEAVPAFGAILTNNFVRGAVSGLGLVNVLAALGELGEMFGARASRNLPADPGPISDQHAR